MRLENSGFSSPESGIERTVRLAENQANFKTKVQAKLEAARRAFLSGFTVLEKLIT
jgi:hypothetical protein